MLFSEGSSGWTNFEEHHHLLGNDEDNSERHSSDDDFEHFWSITDEQREYYNNQFKSMQPDLKKKITGEDTVYVYIFQNSVYLYVYFLH